MVLKLKDKETIAAGNHVILSCSKSNIHVFIFKLYISFQRIFAVNHVIYVSNVLMSFIYDPICGPLHTCEVCEGVVCLFATVSSFVYLSVSFSLIIHLHLEI